MDELASASARIILHLLRRQSHGGRTDSLGIQGFAIVAQLRDRFMADVVRSSLNAYLLYHSVFYVGSAIWRRSHADQHVLPRSQIGLKEDVHPGRDHRDTARQ